MGKMPLAGLLGLVTAITLVTAGCKCGDCCQRNPGKYKANPTFQPGKTDLGPPVVPPATGPIESPPRQPPLDPGPATVPPNGGPPQVSNVPPGGQPAVNVLSPRSSQGFDTRTGNEPRTSHRMALPPTPTG